MSSLYDFLYKFREYLLLLLAILVSFIIMFSNQSPEVRAFRAKVIDGVSFIQKPLLTFQRLGDLETENLRLTRRVTELSLEVQKRNEAMLENARLRKLLHFRDQSQLELQPAKIVNRGGSTIVNSVTIDAGTSQGINPEQAVVVADGIVGKTIQVGKTSALIQLLTDVNFRLSVKTRRTRANGILMWAHDNICSMENVPKTLDIQPGDTVITSGYSDIFPEGLLVGEVVSSSNDLPGYHKRIQVRSFVDFNQLEEVFVVTERPTRAEKP
ncbi:MAG: rod shape-determining protein MreC [Calditrichota bacterium]